MPVPSTIRALLIATVATVALSGCGAVDRINNIGKAPDMSNLSDPTTQKGYQPVRMPMPTPPVLERQANSLWRPGARAFFKDQRASQTGDILTISISINDSANVSDETKRSRANSDSMGMPNFFGLEAQIPKVLNSATSASSLVSTTSAKASDGKGTVARSEQIDLKIAALITQVLPNGNLVIQGKQEVRVNYELRELTIQGIIRPEDIDNTNAISYEKIAEARISYGGRGQITDVQQERYGQQLLDVLLPF
ncbi:flagellar basal body L-ring protein FlgH [Nitrospirillum pindoramense]|uniref:Flagellar L-ring protein n=1 Tax=Nitrospirillum amazonense TaxID=28077 RepID=A0A560HCZ2_9PROT|nr:flagellar basal body L-ring protein FlgH [Nitrospirillum amazonense]TWB44257.1 flagellar L-ring protein precursor FlgH [Nitrospirillum amazonense]